MTRAYLVILEQNKRGYGWDAFACEVDAGEAENVTAISSTARRDARGLATHAFPWDAAKDALAELPMGDD